MRPRSDDPHLVERMQAAHTHAQRTLHTKAVSGGQQVWGWHGRTLGQPVTTGHGRAWLRLASSPADQIIDTYWNGAIHAQHALPASIPRPRLLDWHDWTEPPWAYRAELYEHAPARPITDRVVVTADPDLPRTWWTAARNALAEIAIVPTDRATLHQGFLGWAMPYYLNTPANGHPATVTAHGDFHFANLCGPRLHILDWEGWGTAPAGYDAAMLHSYSLLVPSLAARIRAEFADLLDTDTGRYAELAVITELLHTTTHGNNLALAQPLRHRAAILLGHAVPVIHRRPKGY